MNFSRLFSLVILSLLCLPAFADTRAAFDTTQLTVRLSSRTPQQMAAFYEARGFKKEMIVTLKQQCFITIFIKNKTKDIVWLDLAEWQFHNTDGEIQRLDRNYWKQQWQNMNIPLAHQSTFRWTLIPETLDFQPEEREGGNVVLPRLGKPLSITAKFATKSDKSGEAIHMKIDNFECASQP